MSESNGSLAFAEDLLLAAAQDGDRCAFEKVYRHHRAALLSYCSNLIGDIEQAEDVVQDTFLRAWSNIHTFDLERRFWPWLQTIAQRLCIDHLRSAKSSRFVLADMDLIEHPNGHEPAEAMEVRRNLSGALKTLTPRSRRLLLLQALESWSLRELARADGSSDTAVAKAISRARARAREFLERAGTCLGLTPGFFAGARAWMRRARARIADPSLAGAASGTLAVGESFGVAMFGFAALGASIFGTTAAATTPAAHDTRDIVSAAETRAPRPVAAERTRVRSVDPAPGSSATGLAVKLDQGETHTGSVGPANSKLRLEIRDLEGTRIWWHQSNTECDRQGKQYIPEASPVQAVC